MKRNEHVMFVDGMDWQYEMENDYVKFHCNSKELRKKNSKSGQGIVRVRVSFDGWIEKQDEKKMRDNALNSAEANKYLIEQTRKDIAEKQAYLERLLKEESENVQSNSEKNSLNS